MAEIDLKYDSRFDALNDQYVSSLNSLLVASRDAGELETSMTGVGRGGAVDFRARRVSNPSVPVAS